MTDYTDQMEATGAVDVHVLSMPKPSKRPTYSTCHTFTLVAADPNGAQLILPESGKRIHAMIIPGMAPTVAIAPTSFGWLSTNGNDCEKGLGAFVSALHNPIETEGQSPMYAMADAAATTPLLLTVIADYEA